MKKLSLSLVTMASMSTFAVAGGGIIPVPVQDNVETSNMYIGLGLSAMSSRDSSVSMNIFNVKKGQDRLGNISFHAGYEFMNYLAVEGRYQTTIIDEDRIELNSAWSIFLKPIYKFENDEDRTNNENYFAIYALLGYGGVKMDGVNGVNANIDENGFQWGIGISYTFRDDSDNENFTYKDTWTIFADYTNLGNDMDGLYYTGARQVDADTFTLGVSYKF